MRNSFISETTYALIRQIGVALGHPLWIGAVAALLAAAVVMCTRRARPEIRYNLLTSLLLVFIVATGIAFVQSGRVVRESGSVQEVLEANMAKSTTVPVHTPSPSQSMVAVAVDFLSRNIYAITLVWFVIVFAKITALALGLQRLYRLKTQQLYSIGGHWEQRVAEFAKAMGITQSVKVFQSGLVKVPTVLGHFKPVILVPLGVITAIPADQIEMVLLHELAHIRRLDFFVNFLQRLIEVLFFFNPGILWISRLIREEREHCCDDMAMRHSGNQTVYIRALLSFREYQLSENVYELAFTGKSGLIQRVKRIASRTNPTLGAAEKTVLLVVMLAFFTFSILFAQADDRQSDGRQSDGRQSSGTQNQPQRANPPQSRQRGNTKTAAVPEQNRPGLQPAQNEENTIENQFINTQNTARKQVLKSPAQSGLTSPDTFQPLQKTMAPLYQTAAPLRPDSVGSGPQAPVLRQPYVSTYQMQPLQTYKHEYRPSPIRTQRMAINQKIMDAIERQGIVISRDNIDFRITNKELILNGVKQSDTVLRSVLDAVLTKPGDVIDFTYGAHH